MTNGKRSNRMNGPHNVPQPIPYQGSKRRTAPAILQHFPRTMFRLVEPFAGSAAISLAVAARSNCEHFWINDAHSALIQLWQEIIDRPEWLGKKYTSLWNEQLGQERAYFDTVRDRFNEKHDPGDFLYLLARCVKAAIRYNAKGEFNNTPDNRRKGARPKEMRQRIARSSGLLRGKAHLTSWDYKDVLQDCKEDDLVYMDPPYQGVCGQRDQRYLPKFDHSAFCDELASLNSRNIMFALSYDGRTGGKAYGEPLPESLRLTRLEVPAGRSTQATLLGREEITYESLYLSSALTSSLVRGDAAIELLYAYR